MNLEIATATAENTPTPTPTTVSAPDFALQLSSTPRGARLARLLADEHLRRWGLPTETACQLVAELASNAATHGRVPGRDFRLVLRVIGDVLRIEVTDTRGERRPELRESVAPDAEAGRGLVLVEALADRWGVAEDRFPRKIVWAELRIARPEPVPSRSGCTGDSPEELEGEVHSGG